jgi:putative nucleotidyltransferase with HDIG domain
MQDNHSELIDVSELRIGMFVELDVDWMAHPFLKGSFRIASAKQIEAILSLGLEQVRYVPARSTPDPTPVPEVTPSKYPTMSKEELQALEQARAEALQQRKLRSDMISAQRRSLLACERRFAEAVRCYRQATGRMVAEPQVAAAQCQALVERYVAELNCDGDSAIRLLSEGMGDRNALHPINVTILSLLLGKAMGMSSKDLVDLGAAALLHDIGKLQLPERVRWFEENFSTAEYKLFQQHVAEGVQLARRMELSPGATLAIAQHHELVDGSGFPTRCKGEVQPLASKILALVNRYDDLCNPGRLVASMTPHEALSFIFAQLKHRYDSVVLSAFIRMMGVYPPGSVIQLVDGRYAMVVSVNSTRPLKPRVIVYDPAVPPHEALILDLEQAPEIGIRRSLKPATLPSDVQDYLLPRQRICYFFEQEQAAEASPS